VCAEERDGEVPQEAPVRLGGAPEPEVVGRGENGVVVEDGSEVYVEKGACSMESLRPGVGRLSRATFRRTSCTPIMRSAWVRREVE